MATVLRLDVGPRAVGISVSGSGASEVIFWARHAAALYDRAFVVKSPINLSPHSWRYAIRRLGLVRALRHRGFVPAGY